MKKVFRNIISIVLSFVLAASVAGCGIFGALSEFTAEDFADRYMDTDAMSDIFVETAEKYAESYLAPLRGEGLFGLISDGVESIVRSFIRSDTCRAIADRTAREYTEGFIRYLRTGEGEWSPDRAALSGVSDALIAEIEKSIGFGVGAIGRAWLSSLIDKYIDSILLPQITGIVPTYEQAAESFMPKGSVRAFRAGLALYENGTFVLLCISSALLLLVLGAVLSEKGKRFFGLLPAATGFILGWCAIRLAAAGVPKLMKLPQIALVPENAYTAVNELASSAAAELSKLIASGSGVFLALGAAALAIFIVIALLTRKGNREE